MTIQKINASTSLTEVIDRILEKGIVVDAWVRVSLAGIELLAIEARVILASVDTYLTYAEAVGLTAVAAPPAAGATDGDGLTLIASAPAATSAGPAVAAADEQRPEPPYDDLTRIKGIGPAFQQRLSSLGIHSFAQLALCSAATLRETLGARLANTESWIEQARELAGA